MMNRILFFSLLFLVANKAFPQKIYKWVDENGKVHFSDTQPENAQSENVELKINTYEHVTFDVVDMEKYFQQSSVKRAQRPRGIMYATSWCGYCKKARKYFQENNILYREYDIEQDSKARAAYDRLGATGVPVIVYNGKRMNGFSVAGFNRIYKK